MQKISVNEFSRELMKIDNILILIHSHPDGDAAGSGLALLNVLLKLGKKACLSCSDELPERLCFLKKYADFSKCFFSCAPKTAPEYIITTDVASGTLLGGNFEAYGDRIFLAIDHHNVNTLQCGKMLLDSNASSAGEILYHVIRYLENETGKKLIDADTASLIYTSICSDSGSFKYSNTSSTTFRIAADLLEEGAESEKISRLLFDVKTSEQMRAENICFNNISLFCENKIAFCYIKRDVMKKYGISDADTENAVNIARQIKGVEIALFARQKNCGENEKEEYKVSARSNEYADVSQLCRAFGGGGHIKAAGCTIAGNLEEVKDKLISEAEKYI